MRTNIDENQQANGQESPALPPSGKGSGSPDAPRGTRKHSTKRISPETVAIIQRRVAKGEGIQDIAKDLKISKSTVHRYAEKKPKSNKAVRAKTKTTSPKKKAALVTGSKQGKRLSPEAINEIKRRALAGEDAQEIAAAIGCTTTTVYSYGKKAKKESVQHSKALVPTNEPVVSVVVEAPRKVVKAFRDAKDLINAEVWGHTGDPPREATRLELEMLHSIALFEEALSGGVPRKVYIGFGQVKRAIYAEVWGLRGEPPREATHLELEMLRSIALFESALG
jgi:DNA-binding CsgD family transcriptional regulator